MLSERDYLALCAECDKLLLAPDGPEDRIAVSWLHVLRGHPQILAQYAPVFSSEGPGIFARLARWARRQAQSLTELIRSFAVDGSDWYASGPLPAEFDLLIVSHLLDPAHSGREQDFYFGDLPRQMHDRGLRVAVLLLNHGGGDARELAGRWSGSAVPRIFLSRVLDWRAERRLRTRMRGVAGWLRKRAQRAQLPFAASVARQAAIAAREPAARSNLRIAEQLQSLLAKHGAARLLTTLEGHAWERLTWATAHRNTKPALCLAYQHAAVFRLQHAISRPLPAPYNPDRVLACGEVTATMLAQACTGLGAPVSILGSPRAIVDWNKEAAAGQACLVMPEGMEEECVRLFHFSLDCALRMPAQRFIWRLHPLMNWRRLQARHPRWRALPANVSLSTASLIEDFESSRIVLYRGTTAVLGAVVAGLLPVYLSGSGEMTVDPLWNLEAWRQVVGSVDEFTHLIGRPMDAALAAQLHLAQDYCRRYYTPLDEQALIASLTTQAAPPVAKLPGTACQG